MCRFRFRKGVVITILSLIFLLQIIPAMSLAEEEQLPLEEELLPPVEGEQPPMPVKPYQRVIFQRGSWQIEHMIFDGFRETVVGYTGNREIVLKFSCFSSGR